MLRSLSARLLLTITVLLLLFFSLTALVLDQVFREAADQESISRLEVQRNSLLSVIDFDANQEILMPESLTEPRFNNPGSGLIAFVASQERDESNMLINRLLWKSPSAIGIQEPQLPILAIGNTEHQELVYIDEQFHQDTSSIEWEILSLDEQGANEGSSFLNIIIAVAETQEPYLKQLSKFRQQLFSWFAALTLILLFIIGLSLRQILQPLRRVENEVAEIDSGKRELLSLDYPSELLGVAENTNTLIKAERTRLERYRNTLGNLAHSLKTPLAVIQTSIEKDNIDATIIQKQVTSMNEIVGYQLKRAVTSGSSSLGNKPINLQNEVSNLIDVMHKVYRDKNITIKSALDADVLFFGDKGDLTELLGNLMDNACKWSKSMIQISAKNFDQDRKRPGLIVQIEDDGNGIPDTEKEKILKRGKRADEKTPGHGIGLAIVAEIVAGYEGVINIKDSALGGALFEIILPGL